MWQLPQGPAKNVIRHIENAGCLVIKLDFGTRKIDGCSGWIGDVPVITVVHEFGHLIMHRYPSPDNEREAFAFACELLMPTAEIEPMLRPLSLDKLAQLKLYWAVSMHAIAWNAEMIGAIRPSTTRLYRAKLGARGWLQHEPYDDEMAREEPTLLQEIISTYREDLEYTENDLARLLLLLPKSPDSGQGVSTHLRLVK
jgi:Zn-dependent peptidase ImmA (M78 family)